MRKTPTKHHRSFLKPTLVLICFVVAAGIMASMSDRLKTFAAALPSIIYDNNLLICTTSPCATTPPTAEGNLLVEGVVKITGGTPGSGKVLTSDANGVATWQNPANASTGWTDDGSTVRLTTGTDNVGIGTTDPSAKLDVVGTTKLGNTMVDANGELEINSAGTGSRQAYVDLRGDDTNTDYAAQFIRNSGGANASTQFNHRGTGVLSLTNVNAAGMAFLTTATNRANITSTGEVDFGTAVGGQRFDVNGGQTTLNWNRGTDFGSGIQGQLELNNAHNTAGTNEGVWLSFNREGSYAAQFGLETDNWFSTRGWSAGSSGYVPMRAGLQQIGFNTSPTIYFNDTDHADWALWSDDSNQLVLSYDMASDGTFEGNGMVLSNTTFSGSNLECTNCIDNTDLKTATGVVTSTVPNTTQMALYQFFPNIEYDDCTPTGGSANILRPFQGNAGDNYIGLYSTYITCASGSWDVWFRYIAASRDPEIIAWYDPTNQVIRSLWVNELDIKNLDTLPLQLLEEHPDWIPVQATIFDRDIARFGQKIDGSEILKNYTFTRVAKASELTDDDELIRVARQEREQCLAKARADKLSLDSVDAKCFQFSTYAGIYYGKLEKSEVATQNWQRVEKEQLAAAAENIFTDYADIAENYSGQADVTPGEIIAIDRAQNNFLVRATAAESQQLAGVVSTSPGQVLGHKQDDNIELALIGRVPVKMSQTSLPVQAGDMITISAEPGKGAKATQVGWVVGRALESWEPNSDKDTVLVLLNTTVYDPQLVQKSLDGYTLAENNGSFQIKDAHNQVVDRVLAVKELVVAHLEVGLLRAQQVKIGGFDLGERLTHLEGRVKALENQAGSDSRVVGNVTFPSNARTVLVNEPRVTADTAILLTPRSVTTQHPAVTEVKPGVGFVVSVPRGGEEMSLDYWFVE